MQELLKNKLIEQAKKEEKLARYEISYAEKLIYDKWEDNFYELNAENLYLVHEDNKRIMKILKEK